MQKNVKAIITKLGELNFIATSGLTIFIFSVCIFTEVKLAGVSTFGLLLVALNALHYTKDQTQEWRRREAYHLANSIEEKLEGSLTWIISSIHYAYQSDENPERTNNTARRAFEDLDVIDINKIQNILSSIRTVNHFLKSVGDEDINKIERVIEKSLIYLSYHYTNRSQITDLGQLTDTVNTQNLAGLKVACDSYCNNPSHLQVKLVGDLSELKSRPIKKPVF